MPWWSASVYMGQKPFQKQQKKKKGQTLLVITTIKQLDLHRNHSHSLSLWMQDLGCCPPNLAQLTPFSREKESREGG